MNFILQRSANCYMYKEAILRILNGIANDNAREIRAGCEWLILLARNEPVNDESREYAAHLTKLASATSADHLSGLESVPYDRV